MWYRYGYSSGGWGHGPYTNYGPCPDGARTDVEIISVAHDHRESDVEVGVFWSDTPLEGRRKADNAPAD